ncbi:hypothetical protein [Sulfurimonas sp.]|uniref:hypothetical protein n=1 Tax=Sulfurimonas sp. TaxID=2022749 RepID=UPI003C751C86
MSLKNTLNSLDFFKTLKEKEIILLCSISSIQSLNENYILHYEKEQSSSLVFLVNGLAKAYKIDKHSNEIFLYYIYKNSLLSDITDINNNTITSYSNISLAEDSIILSINYAQFRIFFCTKIFYV